MPLCPIAGDASGWGKNKCGGSYPSAPWLRACASLVLLLNASVDENEMRRLYTLYTKSYVKCLSLCPRSGLLMTEAKLNKTIRNSRSLKVVSNLEYNSIAITATAISVVSDVLRLLRL